jgi:threonine dehydratase
LTQHAGSFKARGAFANLLTRSIPDAGVVAASGGNHGAAVAYAANRLGIPATIYVPTVSSPVKVSRIRAFGADVVIHRRSLCRCAGSQRALHLGLGGGVDPRLRPDRNAARPGHAGT